MKATSLIVLAWLGATPLLAQAEPQEAASHEELVSLAVQLRPGFLWRQNVRFEHEFDGENGVESRWTFDYQLRLHCLEEMDGAYSIEAEFIDWLLRLEFGGQLFEWHDGNFRVESEGVHPLPDEDPSVAAVGTLLRAWDSGLRQADIRFSLHPDGTLSRFRGLDTLHEEVALALAESTELPAKIATYFGEEGQERAEYALGFALAAPRPTEPVGFGHTWDHQCMVEGIYPEACQVTRRFRFDEYGMERRHRFAKISIEPELHWRSETGDLVPFEREPGVGPSGHLHLLEGRGLVYSMEMDGTYQIPGGTVTRIGLRSRFLD